MALFRLPLRGGPYNGGHFDFENRPPAHINYQLDEDMRPAGEGNSFASLRYDFKDSPEPHFAFGGVVRNDGKPFEIEYSDGPNQGIVPSGVPIHAMPAHHWVVLGSDNKPFDDTTDVAAVAIYSKRAGDDGMLRYYLDRIDDSPATVEEAANEVNDQRATMAIEQFYLNPDYDIYSMKPTDDHPQILIEQGHRRAMVDEKMAEVIKELWRINIDTIGSCQDVRPGEKNSGKAYVGFIKIREAKVAFDAIRAAGIEAEIVEKNFGIARRSKDGAEGKKLTLKSANITFAPPDIGRVTAALAVVAAIPSNPTRPPRRPQ